ncbi:hypothetical protein I7I48_05272 [Histoplasma ohiense]|nr:hypothetical protein I7I48_05272 [Histoplasma ohiense (nom. inval.)]
MTRTQLTPCARGFPTNFCLLLRNFTFFLDKALYTSYHHNQMPLLSIAAAWLRRANRQIDSQIPLSFPSDV